MWADTIALRIGDWRLGLRLDSRSAAQKLRRSLNAHIDDIDSLPPSNFSIRSPSRRFRRRSGALFHGGFEIATSPRLADLVGALAEELGVIAVTGRDVISVDLRVAVRDNRAVLVEARRGAISRDEGCRIAGISELHSWRALLTPNGEVLIPSPLAEIAGRRSDARRPAQPGSQVKLVGVVASSVDGLPPIASAWRRAASRRSDWLTILQPLDASGCVVGLPENADLATVVDAALRS